MTVALVEIGEAIVEGGCRGHKRRRSDELFRGVLSLSCGLAAVNLQRAEITMITPQRKTRTTGVAAVCAAVVLALLATARPASAAPLTRVGDFFFDFPGDPTEPVVHLTNEWTEAISAFTITFVSDLVDFDGTTTVDVRPVASTTPLAAGDSFQIFAFDLTPPGAFLTPLSATLSRFVLATPGAIFFSYDGGATFVTNPILNFSSDLSDVGIFFAPNPPTVPEPGTLILLATGAVLSLIRRGRRKTPTTVSPVTS